MFPVILLDSGIIILELISLTSWWLFKSHFLSVYSLIILLVFYPLIHFHSHKNYSSEIYDF